MTASNATLTAPVDVFVSYLQCKEASLQLQDLVQISVSGGIHNGPQFTFTLGTDDCVIHNRTAAGGFHLDYNYVGLDFIFYDTWGIADFVNCSKTSAEPQDIRILFSIGRIHYNSK